MKEYRFKGKLEDAGGGGVFVYFPYDVKKEFGKGRVPVQCAINGLPYRGTMVKYGSPQHIIPVLKAIREKLGKKVGDEVEIWLIEDKEERTIEVPEILQALLKKNNLQAVFDKKSFTQRKEWIVLVEGAKREETRLSRLNKIIEQLKTT